jgi:hypothetical protein
MNTACGNCGKVKPFANEAARLEVADRIGSGPICRKCAKNVFRGKDGVLLFDTEEIRIIKRLKDQDEEEGLRDWKAQEIAAKNNPPKLRINCDACRRSCPHRNPKTGEVIGS